MFLSVQVVWPHDPRFREWFIQEVDQTGFPKRSFRIPWIKGISNVVPVIFDAELTGKKAVLLVWEDHGAISEEAVQQVAIGFPSLSNVRATGCHEPSVLFFGRLKEDQIGC